jgi:alpha-tubulin suppressor-like RCC1 family protein
MLNNILKSQNSSFPSIGLATCSGALLFYIRKNGSLGYISDNITNYRSQGINMTPPAGLGKCKQVAVGYRSAVVLKTDGTVVGWGDDGNTNQTNTQYFMEQLNQTGKKITKIAAGAYHYVALLDDGSVVTWGNSNASAQLSDPNTVWSPVGLIPRPTAAEHPYVVGYTAYAIWEYKQDASTFAGTVSSPTVCVPTPDPNIFYRQFRNLDYGCPLHNGESYGPGNPNGGYDTPYIRPAGSSYGGTYPIPNAGSFAWGGQLNWLNDTGAPYDYQFSRATVGETNSVNYSGTGSSWVKSTAHLTMANGCYNGDCSSPNSLFGTSNKKYVDIAAGRGHTILLTSDGNIETWGESWYYTITGSGVQGNLGWGRVGSGIINGINTETNNGWGKKYPFPPAPLGDNTAPTVKLLKTTPGLVKGIGTGYYTSKVIKSDGSIFAWDRNEWGESTPFFNSDGTSGIPTGPFKQVTGGYHHTGALREDGTVVCWGENNSGECNVPIGLKNCIQISVGARWTAALRNDGIIIFWGEVDVFGAGYTSVKDVNNIKMTDLVINTAVQDNIEKLDTSIEVSTDAMNLDFTNTEKSNKIPVLLQNNIKYGQLAYGSSGICGSNFTVNEAQFKSFLSDSLSGYLSNTGYTSYFGTSLHSLVLDYENEITNYINGDVDPISGSSCEKASNLLNTLLVYAKDVSPNSIVYEYNVPNLPYYFAFTEGNACTWYGKSGAVSTLQYETEKSRLLNQQKLKLQYFKKSSDYINIASYPTYTDNFYAYASEGTQQWIYYGLCGAAQSYITEYPIDKPLNIFTTFTTAGGSEYVLTGTASNAMTGYTSLQNYQSLVSYNSHLGIYNFKPATDIGCRKAFMWFPLLYTINLAKSSAGNCWATGSDIYATRKVLNDLWCDTQTSIYTIPQTEFSRYAFKYTLPLDDDAIWSGSKSLVGSCVSPGGIFADVRAKTLQAGITKIIQMTRLFKSWAGDTGPMTEDCATVIGRTTPFIQGLTAYNGNLSYVPYDPSIFTTTGSTISTRLASLANNYQPTLQTEIGRYTRAYRNADVPLYNRFPSTITPNGALSNCSNPIITRIAALTGSDTNIGQWIRTSGFNLAFGWKVGDARVADGRSISPGSTTSQATVLNNANTILSEIATHVPFERYGWTITDCDFNPNLLIYSGNEPINDGKYLGSAWYNNGVISMMHALGTAGMTTGLETKLRGLLEGEVYGLIENWVEKYGWYTKGQLTGMPVGSGQPNTNQWIEPAAALLNISLYLGDKKFLPSYNLGVALLAESFAYEGADGGFAEGFGYAQQTVGEMVNSVNYMVATGDTRLVDPVKFPFLQNYWQWAIDCQLPGNYIINCQDNRGGQQANYTIGYYWPSILASALSYQGNTALANFKYLFPTSLPDLQGLQYTIAAQGITAALTIPNYKFYPDKQQVIWRTGRDKPSVIGNPYDVGLSTFGNTATPHYAIWAKGSSVKEGHKHTDQGHISVYQGYKVILMDCGIDYDETNPELINPIDTLQQATGHNMTQVNAVDKSVVINVPITVTTLGTTGGNITINGTSAYTNINSCTRNIIWGATGFNGPLNVTIFDNFNKTNGVTAGLEVYRLHTGNTDGISISGSGTGWTASWANITMGFTSNFNITVGQTGFNDFTQLVASGTNLGNARVHKMLNISTVNTITAGNTFSLTTTLVVSP